jgi:hypothetical protein
LFGSGIQRRYDDETKRRAVLRKVPQFFDNDNFYIMGSYSKKEKEELTADLELYGGVHCSKITKKVSHHPLFPSSFSFSLFFFVCALFAGYFLHL